MSTTIYTGFKISEKYNTGSITDLQSWVNAVSTFVKKEFNKQYCAIHTEITTNVILGALYENKNINEELNKTIKLIKEEYPIPEICIYMYKNNIYGAFFKDTFGIRKKLLKRGYIEDFSYWDNTDPDEEISEAEWELRQEVWDSMENWHMTLNFVSYLMYSGFYLKPLESLSLKRYKIKKEQGYIDSYCFSVLNTYLFNKYIKQNETHYYNDISNKAAQNAKKLIINPELASDDEKEILNKLETVKTLYVEHKDN